MLPDLGNHTVDDRPARAICTCAINITIVETNDAPAFPSSFDNHPTIVEIEPGDAPEVVIDIIPSPRN